MELAGPFSTFAGFLGGCGIKASLLSSLVQIYSFPQNAFYCDSFWPHTSKVVYTGHVRNDSLLLYLLSGGGGYPAMKMVLNISTVCCLETFFSCRMATRMFAWFFGMLPSDGVLFWLPVLSILQKTGVLEVVDFAFILFDFGSQSCRLNFSKLFQLYQVQKIFSYRNFSDFAFPLFWLRFSKASTKLF